MYTWWGGVYYYWTWWDASWHCSVTGGWLALPTNAGENNIVRSIIGSPSYGVYLGGTRYYNGQNVDTYTYSTNRIFDYANWASGQPTDNDQNWWNWWQGNKCMYMNANGQWYNGGCGEAGMPWGNSYRLGHVCQANPSSNCIACPDNSYSPLGSLGCICNPGYYSNGLINSALVCSPCPGLSSLTHYIVE